MIYIDLGTSKTKIGIERDDSLQKYSFATRIFLDSNVFDSDETVFSALKTDRIDCYYDNFKKDIGCKYILGAVKRNNMLSKNTAFDIAYKYLSQIRKRIENQCGSISDLQNTVISFPQTCYLAQQNELKKVFIESGFHNIEEVSEPEAIATYFKYCIQAIGPQKHILVIDWGHSALKLSLLKKDVYGEYTATAHARDFSSTGARIFDDELFTVFRKKTEITEEQFCKNPVLCIKIQQMLDAIKEKLYKNEITRVKLQDSDATCLFSISTAEYQKIVEKTVAIAYRNIKEFLCSIPAEEYPQGMILSGGAFHNPQARELITRTFPDIKSFHSTNPSDDTLSGLYEKYINNKNKECKK